MSVVTHELPGTPASEWHSTPELPLENPPVFEWPPRPLAAARYLVSRDFLWINVLPYVALAIVTYVPEVSMTLVDWNG